LKRGEWEDKEEREGKQGKGKGREIEKEWENGR